MAGAINFLILDVFVILFEFFSCFIVIILNLKWTYTHIEYKYWNFIDVNYKQQFSINPIFDWIISIHGFWDFLEIRISLTKSLCELLIYYFLLRKNILLALLLNNHCRFIFFDPFMSLFSKELEFLKFLIYFIVVI